MSGAVFIPSHVEELPLECESPRGRVVVRVGTIHAERLGVLEVDVQCAAAGAQGARICGERLNRVRDPFGGVVVIVVHVNDDVSLRVRVHDIAFLTQCHLLLVFEIAHLRYVRYEVFDRVAAIIDNDPLHTLFWIVLLFEAFNNVRYELSPVKGWCAYADKWQF